MATGSAMTLPESVTVPATVVIDAIAALRALADYDALRANPDNEPGTVTGVEDWTLSIAGTLERAAFGEFPETELDDEETWPVEVAYTARAEEMEADLIEHVLNFDAKNSALHWRAGLLRKHAARIRKAGTVGAPFPVHPGGESDDA